MAQITHRIDPETSRMVQIVSADELRKVLDESGDDYSRPRDFGPDDEWDVGDRQCDGCGAVLTTDETTRNERENLAAQYDANAFYCDKCSAELED